MPTGIGLMGLGRIGRNIFRILYKSDDLRLEAVSDVADPAALAYLLRFDTILGRFPDELSSRTATSTSPGAQVRMLTEEKGSQASLPGASWGSTWSSRRPRKFRTRAEVERHFAAGSQAGDPLLAAGRSAGHHRGHRASTRTSSAPSTGSSPTPRARRTPPAPVLKILDDAFGIERAFLTTVHAYTNQQRLADVPADDPRRGRAAAENIIPQETDVGRARHRACCRELKGKLTGYSHERAGAPTARWSTSSAGTSGR